MVPIGRYLKGRRFFLTSDIEKVAKLPSRSKLKRLAETDKVAKATFEVMLEYLAGLPSNQKGRVIEVA